MVPYFPKIYDDELLASAIARYHSHTMGTSYYQTHRELYGRAQQRTSINFPRNLRKLHTAIAENIGKSLNELVSDATLYPYYFAFHTDSVRKRVFNSMCEQFTGGSIFLFGYAPLSNCLKACPDCIRDEIRNLGEAYWHRTHQIDSVHLCTIHGRSLLNAQTRYFDSNGCALDPLTHRTLLTEYLPKLTERCRQRLTEISARSHGYLNGPTGADRTYSHIAEARAFLKNLYPFRSAGLDIARLEKDIIEHFGEQCLNLLGLTIHPSHKGSWISRMFGTQTSPQPTKHIVIKIFVDDFVRHRIFQIQDKQDILSKLSRRRWPCYNPAADHFGENIVEEVYKSKGYYQNGLLGFSCDCGYVYLVKEDEWDLESKPVAKKVLAFGPVFLQKVKSLSAAGVNCHQIALQLGCAHRTAKNMLNEDHQMRTRRTQIEATEVRRARINSQRAENPKVQRRVDYVARDIEFARRVCAAAETLQSEVPLVRASRNRIVKTAGIKHTQLVRKHFYPTTTAALDKLSEQAEGFRTRIATWRAKTGQVTPKRQRAKKSNGR
ncbi:TnsD family Tn7-like transposition protein [Janthinobacterium sp. FW305-128]|uniref:TnsD family Tn7-like transposition protein n=1 Tax=Janthinobacterium sp. FW305-128 TaxID=2775055 RepID=UPI001E46F0A3|nr:TnsD family Tn7-like transposition protein [Janthinobacterium sp. FW305-128]MCC7682742.1 TniQ family protein [Janthinobacterium sp. FW305-128]